VEETNDQFLRTQPLFEIMKMIVNNFGHTSNYE